MKNILQKLSILAAIVTLVLTFAIPTLAFAQTKDDIERGLDLTGAPSGSGEREIGGVIEEVINILSLVVGIIAVIMIIVGGLKYITSSGDSNSVNSAKNTILYAIIGLVVVALAQFIVRFVLGRV